MFSRGTLKTIDKPTASEKTSGLLVLPGRFLEVADPNGTAREAPVIIIKEGMGNLADRHFYSAELLQKIVSMFDGVKAYADHPSKTEESDRPERSIKDIVGYYHSPRVTMVEGKTAIAAILKINHGPAYDWAWDLVKEAAIFAKRFENRDYVGISINAWGASHPVEHEGGIVNMVDDLTEVQSADIVTQAGAGGGFRLREAVKKALSKGRTQEGHYMRELLNQHGAGLAELRSKVKSDPAAEQAYGPALEALVGHCAEMMKGADQPPVAPPAAAVKPPEADPVKQEAEKPVGEETFEQMQERYKGGKMSPTECKVFEALNAARAEAKVAQNKAMIERLLKEAAIPEAFAEDLPIICAGKAEDEAKKIIESRKKLVAPLMENRGSGAGAGGEKGKETPSKLSEKMKASGIALKA